MAQLFDTHYQDVNSSGVPRAGAKLYFYQAGTTTPFTIYQDQAAVTPHANPVVADSAGLFAPIYITGVSSFKIVLKTSADVVVQTVDNIQIFAASGNNSDITQVRLNNDGLKMWDSNATHTLTIAPGSNLTANRTFTITTGDADRNLTLNGNAALDNWFDQSVKIAASPTFVVVNASDYFQATSGSYVLRFEPNTGSANNISSFNNPITGYQPLVLDASTLTFRADASATVLSANSAGASITGTLNVSGHIGASTGNASAPYLQVSGISPGLFSFQQGGIVVGAPTGGNLGAGIINAEGVRDDNVLLTCYPFDAYLDGKIDEAKWDSKVPDRIIAGEPERQVQATEPVIERREVIELVDGVAIRRLVEEAVDRPIVDFVPVVDDKGAPVLREVRPGRHRPRLHPVPRMVTVPAGATKVVPRRHEDMRKFRDRLGTDTDPLNLEKYIAHWKEKRHLTSMPNEEKFNPMDNLMLGSWTQRLIETVEIQAIHMSQLLDMNKELKARLDKAGL